MRIGRFQRFESTYTTHDTIMLNSWIYLYPTTVIITGERMWKCDKYIYKTEVSYKNNMNIIDITYLGKIRIRSKYFF